MRYAIGLVAAFLWAFASLATASAEKRVALVIGNSAYRHAGALPNPKNDAEAIAKLLRDMGFDDVALKINLDYRVMRESVRTFEQAAREADVDLVYFAGHGLEVAGENYLVPIDAKLVRDSDLEYEAVTLASVLSAVGGARRLRVVILDACRNNPLGEKIALRTGIRRSVTRGLARIEPSGDVLVAYAAKAGTLAEDGRGANSPFAIALIEHMAMPGLDVRLMFGKVRDSVLVATRQRQEPYTYGSLSGDIVPLVPGTPPTKGQQVELLYWASVKDSTNPSVLSTYLDRYPNGEFAPIARALIQHYEHQLKMDLATREEERKRREAALKAAEAKRLEEERRVREAALADERREAQEAKDGERAKKLEEKQKVEALAIAESMQKALGEEIAARTEAKLAEEKRVKAAKEADQAKKSAEEAISKKLEAAKSDDPTKIAVLPKIETPGAQGSTLKSFDGTWRIVWSLNEHCTRRTDSSRWTISKGLVANIRGFRGTVDGTGLIRFNYPCPRGPRRCYNQLRLRGASGAGRSWVAGHGCTGRITATKM